MIKFAIIAYQRKKLPKFISDLSSRLDMALSQLMQISRSQSTDLIKSNLVKINQKIITKPSYKISIGDEIIINTAIQTEEKKTHYEVNFDIPIIYEDDDILVLNKPPGIIVHGAKSVKEATIVEWLYEKKYTLSTIAGKSRAGIVHRLDKGTSGAIVVAKNNISHTNLSEQLQDKSMGRIYLLISNLPLKESCIIDRPIGRNPSNRLKKIVTKNNSGKNAKSAFANLISQDEVQNKNTAVNLIIAKLFTGRTHQIRAHLASINRHILGDDLYGFKSQNDKIKRVMLHAYILHLKHPRTGESMSFVAPLYEDFRQILNNRFEQGIIDEKINPDTIFNIFSDVNRWMCYQ